MALLTKASLTVRYDIGPPKIGIAGNEAADNRSTDNAALDDTADPTNGY